MGIDLDEIPVFSIVSDVSEKGWNWLSGAKVFSIDDMEALTLFGAYDDSWARTWQSRFEECRAVSNKVIDKPFRPIDALSPMEVEQWRGEMKVEFATALKAWASDPGHWMPLRSFLFPANSQSFRATNQAWFIKQIIVPGRFAIIDGDLDSGKTDHSVKLSQIVIDTWEQHERLQKESDLSALDTELTGETEKDNVNTWRSGLINSKGPRIITNVEVNPNQPPASVHYTKYFQFFARLSDMIIQMARNALDGYFSILILDEMGMTYNRKRVTSRQNFSLEGIFRLVRKFNASVIVITQNKELDLPDHLRRPDKGAKTIIEKLTKSVARYTVYGVPQLMKQKVHSIPSTTIKYETKAVASLAIDLDPRTLVEEVELIKSNERAEGREFSMEDSWRAMIHYCEEVQKQHNRVGNSIVMRQRVMAMLQSMNDETGELYTPEDIAEELSASLSFIQECQATLHEVGDHPQSAADGVIEERVMALLGAGLPDAEVARLAGVEPTFVAQVKQKHQQPPVTPSSPAPPSSSTPPAPPSSSTPPAPPSSSTPPSPAPPPPSAPPPPVTPPSVPVLRRVVEKA